MKIVVCRPDKCEDKSSNVVPVNGQIVISLLPVSGSSPKISAIQITSP